MSVGGQIYNYLNLGEFRDCRDKQSNFLTCLRAQTIFNDAKAKEYLRAEIIVEGAKKEEAVWSLKEKPSWD